MGQFLAILLGSFVGPRELRIVMVGLDGAGKTNLLYKLKLGENLCTEPTFGFHLETVQYKNINFTIWDLGGQHRLRSIWRQYFGTTQGMIFVVDSADKERLCEARDELHNLLKIRAKWTSDPELAHLTLLVLANKIDLPQAMNVAEITDKLQLTNLRKANWYIQSCSAISGDGLCEGLHWLAQALQDVAS
ncbi:hypothetical protein R1sor_013520 [Riccia sorocarpa]|uniref:ADP-ribosylation factor n=1 Tax=Riccia sorocarpa TaxID=122646 RepID=A0ABD3H8R5_9MARC